MTLPTVSGRYRGAAAGLVVELRIDIDGTRPTNRVSADYAATSADGPDYLGSMRVDAPKIVYKPKVITITGSAFFTFGTVRRRIKVTIPRTAAERSPATLDHVASSGRPGLRCACQFEGEHFRHVAFEEARERGVERPPAYDTTSFRSRPRPRSRSLQTVDSFAEAGIELAETGPTQVIETVGAGADAAWSDAELHAAMEQHFTLLSDEPQWAMWLLHAGNHTDPTITGLMFDRRGLQRQGCAVFHGYTSAENDPERRRDRLYNCVHEVGHGFNLRHCWQHSLYVPPVPSRPQALSWMNYPTRFARGPEPFFQAFGYDFDDAEIVHLRHGARRDVIPGGAPFGRATGGAALVRDDGWSPERRDPGLRLRLTAPRELGLNVPVSVGLELTSTSRRERMVPTTLGPRPTTVDIAIRRPDGTETVFEPLLQHCRPQATTVRGSGAATVRDLAFIHYGRNGFAFREPGTYRLRARYTAPDGRIALSEVQTLRVRAATSRADRRVEALIGGDDQVGTLMSLVGSRAPELSEGDAKLRELIASQPRHPVAAVARLVRGIGLARAFKVVGAEGAVRTLPAEIEEASALVAPVIDIAALRVGGPAATRGEIALRAVVPALTRLGVTAEVAPVVAGFAGSRRGELETVQPRLTQRRIDSPAPRRRSPPESRTRPQRRSSDLCLNRPETASPPAPDDEGESHAS